MKNESPKAVLNYNNEEAKEYNVPVENSEGLHVKMTMKQKKMNCHFKLSRIILDYHSEISCLRLRHYLRIVVGLRVVGHWSL